MIEQKKIDGKPFECTKCGDCCRWQGKVYLSPEDTHKLALHIGLAIDDFLSRYTEDYGSSTVLKNKEDSQDCIFMEDNQCGVHGSHPRQCEEWPVNYDQRCPGFTNNGGEGPMDYKEAVERVNKKFSALREWDQTVTDQFYKGLLSRTKEAEIASKALADGVDPYSTSTNSVRVASVDDLFAFHRAGDNHLIHKSTRDLWSIESDKDGGVRITRLFDNEGEPIKG